MYFFFNIPPLMKNLFLLSILIFVYSCEIGGDATAADENQNVDLLANTFNFELVGDVTEEKMKTVTTINIRKKGSKEIFQQLTGFEAFVQENEQIVMEDLNFDGYGDIRLLQFLPEDASVPFFYWLYNPKTEKYVRNKKLEIVHSPSLDRKQALLLSQWGDGDSIQGTDFYQFRGHQIKLVKQEIQQIIDDKHYALIFKEPIGDSLQEVERKTIKRDPMQGQSVKGKVFQESEEDIID